MSSSNYVENVAIVGAGGNVGSFITAELLKTGKHTVTALTRVGSTSKLPDGVKVKEIDYEKPETLVDALRGQDALIITLSVFAPKDTQQKLVRAAGEAGVPWILPNHWAPDTTDEGSAKDVVNFGGVVAEQKAIEEHGKSAHISLATGFWYEWSLSIASAYGFDLQNRQVTFFDDGATKISTSTWPQVGRAVAGLLSLPVKADGSGKGLEDFKNQTVFINSFTVSQQDMLASVQRVTGTKPEDWTITTESSVDRYTGGVRTMREGGPAQYDGFVKMMYTRVFYQDGSGDFETRRGTLNSLLGLPKEDIDEATKVAIERAEKGKSGYNH